MLVYHVYHDSCHSDEYCETKAKRMLFTYHTQILLLYGSTKKFFDFAHQKQKLHLV